MNSTTVLEKLRLICNENTEPYPDIRVDILAQALGMSTTKLVSVLTELEHRDQIKMDISAAQGNTGEPEYTGTIRLMRRPPDDTEQPA